MKIMMRYVFAHDYSLYLIFMLIPSSLKRLVKNVLNISNGWKNTKLRRKMYMLFKGLMTADLHRHSPLHV